MLVRKRLTITLPEHLIKECRALAAPGHLSDMIRQAIDRYLHGESPVDRASKDRLGPIISKQLNTGTLLYNRMNIKNKKRRKTHE